LSLRAWVSSVPWETGLQSSGLPYRRKGWNKTNYGFRCVILSDQDRCRGFPFDPERYFSKKRLAVFPGATSSDHRIQEAWASSRLDQSPLDRERVGVVLGAGSEGSSPSNNTSGMSIPERKGLPFLFSPPTRLPRRRISLQSKHASRDPEQQRPRSVPQVLHPLE